MFLRPVDKKGLFLWLGLSVVVFGIAWQYFSLDPLFSSLLGTNIATMIAMLIDKTQASAGGRRLSERSLYIMTFLGGSIGMLVSMSLFRHKTRKTSFQIVVGLLVLIQVAFLFWFFSDQLTPLLEPSF